MRRTTWVLALAAVTGFTCVPAVQAADTRHMCPSSSVLAEGKATAEKTVQPGTKIDTGKLAKLLEQEAAQRAVAAASRAARNAKLACRPAALGRKCAAAKDPSPKKASEAKTSSEIKGGGMGGITVYGYAPWQVTGICKLLPVNAEPVTPGVTGPTRLQPQPGQQPGAGRVREGAGVPEGTR